VAGWGTRGYLAPERALGQKVSTASDWFSVGAVLYEALTGKVPPRRADGRIKRLAAEVDAERMSFDSDTPDDLVELCRRLLVPNPAQRARTLDVANALGTELVTEGPPSLLPERFVGRRGELESLRRAHALACRGVATVVHVRGPSGIGKSALVRQFVRTLDTPAAPLVLDGRCYELESVPYKGLEEVADTIARFLLRLEPDAVAEILPEDAHLIARIFPVLRRVPELSEVSESEAVDPHMLRRRAFRALKSLLARLAESRPTLVVVDDLQWGDMDTVHLLNEILSTPDPPALLVILVYRTEGDHEGPVARELARQRAGTEGPQTFDLALDALSQQECTSLARSLTHGDEASAAVIARESAGSPFLVELLARHAAGARQMPPSLQGALSREIEQLDGDARRLLEIVAVSGRPLSQDIALQSAGPLVDPRATFAQLRARNLVRTCGQTADSDVEVYHDAVRASVLALMSDDVLRVHHRALAAALEDRADTEALARHLHGAGDALAAARHATAAAEAAEELWAFDRAAELYAFACECDPPNRAALSVKRADALANAGRSGEAAEVYLSCARESKRMDLQRRAAEEYMVSGRIAIGIDVLRPVLERAGLSYRAAPWRAMASIAKNLARLTIRGHAFEARQEVEPASAERLATCFSAGRGLIACDPLRSADYLVQATLLALDAGDAAHVARGLSY
ncbi:MAG TPA: AAA family ATPase, partial [Polyangiaceae bacterium]|nr:AAA family ATPase [Polyangiaceae bacterium]